MRYRGHFRFLVVNRGPVRWAFSRFDRDVRVAVMNIMYASRARSNSKNHAEKQKQNLQR